MLLRSPEDANKIGLFLANLHQQFLHVLLPEENQTKGKKDFS